MSTNEQLIADLKLNTDKPTRLSFSELYTWIIWQFPRPKFGKLCGAVHPPEPKHGWYPALINSKKKRLDVYAHLGKVFSTPEAAADHLKTEKSA